MTDAFSSNSEAVLQRTVNVSTITSSHAGNLMQLYQIAETCRFVTSNQFTKVALQFPDELLPDAVRVSAEIENETKAKTYILGDTSYGR
ncbi:2-(3-amino-3-carboxypropyl)histidine synthase subunit [Pimephales promelas]|nr:2-(3-amino-3-carboxypropyl)histidine synthase subunit [Pimephales promelas]